MLQSSTIKGVVSQSSRIIGVISKEPCLIGVISNTVLKGVISTGINLIGVVSKQPCLSGVISKPLGYVDYTGDYEVTPSTNKQSLYTRDKHMVDDVTVKAIPYFEVSNNSGGKTITIGIEV